MKKNLFISALLLVLLGICNLRAIAQNAEGEIVYSASIVAELMPDIGNNPFPLITMKFKGDKEVMSMNKLPMMAAALPIEKTIYDFKTKQVDMLLDKDGKKYDVVTSQDEVANMMKAKGADTAASGLSGMGSMLNLDSLKVNFVPTDSIVTVMGYRCRKYTGSNSLMKMELYASDSANLPQKMAGSLSTVFNSAGMGGNYTGVKGFIVKSVIHMSTMGMDMQIVMAVSKVSFKKVSDSEFDIPANYEKVTFKDYQKIMSGNYIQK